jgi:hypothetical protein
MASRFAAFREFAPPNPAHQTQGTFVYRHMEVAEYYWSIAAAAFHNPENAEMFLHSSEGKICWKNNDMTGPFWNFSNPKAQDWFVEEIGGELTREADINMVFFDETDWLYCGPVFNNCSHSVITPDRTSPFRLPVILCRALLLLPCTTLIDSCCNHAIIAARIPRQD